MERNALFKLAKEVGFEDYDLVPNVLMCDAELLEAFAKLVAAKEREACAQAAEVKGPCGFTAENCANAIRARGEK